MGTRMTGSNFRVSTTSYGTPAAFAARSLIRRVFSERTSGASINKMSSASRVQGTSGWVVTDSTLSVGVARYCLRLILKLRPPGAVITAGAAGVGPVIEPELVVVAIDVPVPWLGTVL